MPLNPNQPINIHTICIYCSYEVGSYTLCFRQIHWLWHSWFELRRLIL